jgi:hypothetical protein
MSVDGPRIMPPFQFKGQAEASLIFAVTMFPPSAPIKAASSGDT